MKNLFLVAVLILLVQTAHAQEKRGRAREFGITIGVMQPGARNMITDVSGVKVGQVTKVEGASIRTGVTVILPHAGNLFQDKVPAAVFVGNGFGKLVGTTQVQELGNLETPIALTNTLSVPAVMEALVRYTLQQPGNEKVQSVNAVTGETNDGWLNDIRGMHVRDEDVLQAIAQASDGVVAEGCVGAGTGTMCLGFKGGIGTSSRKLPKGAGGYTVGVLVQSNFGGVLQIDGVPVGEELGRYYMSNLLNEKADGSCMIIVATDAPLDARNLRRLAERAFMGLAKTGGIAANGSGDYVIAFSTSLSVRIAYESKDLIYSSTQLSNDAMSPLFMAAIEATEEAIINSLFQATSMEGKEGHKAEALPIEKVLDIMRKHNALKK